MKRVVTKFLWTRVVALRSWWRSRTGRQKTVVLLVAALALTSSFLGWRVYQLTRPEPELLCKHLPTAELVPIVGYQPRQDGPPFEGETIYSCTVKSPDPGLPAQATSLLWESGTRSDLSAVYPSKEELIQIAAKDPRVRIETEVPGHPEAFLFFKTGVPCVYWVNQTHAVRACADPLYSITPDQEEHLVNQLRTLILAHATNYLPNQPTPTPTR